MWVQKSSAGREVRPGVPRSTPSLTARSPTRTMSDEKTRSVAVANRGQEGSALRGEHELLEAVLENVPDMVYFKDLDSRFIRISRELANRFGLSDRAGAIGKTDFDYYTAEHANPAYRDEQKIIGTGRSIVGIEEKETWPDGRETWVLTTKVALRDPRGQIVGTMGISRDITERKRSEQALQMYRTQLEGLVEARTLELQEANKQLQRDIAARALAEKELAARAGQLARSNADLEQFAYVASHDLQEPLRMVASFTQLLARSYKGKLDADADEFIGFAVDGVNRMKQLIEDLLAYSRVTRKEDSFESIDSGCCCARALANLQKAIEESGACVTVEALPMVVANAAQLDQVFQNLIGNAIKYRGKCRLEIHIAAKRENGFWVFSVQDNGLGIEPQYFEKIFQMFQRLHTRFEYEGTGLGLALCRKIVEHHGGKIWVQSQLGAGSTFSFSLPDASQEQRSNG
jgi:PAS domain S-box-containing protein